MKTGRPFARIDRKRFEALCSMRSTLRAAARSLKISEDTLERWCLRNYGQRFRVVRKRLRSEFLDRVLQVPPQKRDGLTDLPGLDALALGLPNMAAMRAEEMQEFARILSATMPQTRGISGAVRIMGRRRRKHQ